MRILSGMDNAGQPTVQTTGCSSDVRTLTVHLHGDHAKFFEVFDQQVAQRMKTQLKTKVRGILIGRTIKTQPTLYTICGCN